MWGLGGGNTSLNEGVGGHIVKNKLITYFQLSVLVHVIFSSLVMI